MITSVQNSRVKQIARLQRKASFRRTEGQTVIEGEREIRRAVENGWRPAELWYCSELNAGPPPAVPGLCPVECSRPVFEKMSGREGPDGILAVGPPVGKTLNELNLPKEPLILVVEAVEKPGNLGALLRTADGAGADAVIVCDPAADLNSPNVIRASIGTLFYIPVAEASSEETLSFLKEKGIIVFAAGPDADTVYTDADWTGPLAVAVGAEDRGLSPFWKERADAVVRIPMRGKNDSLNVSVSAAVLLYEAVRRREKK